MREAKPLLDSPLPLLSFPYPLEVWEVKEGIGLLIIKSIGGSIIFEVVKPLQSNLDERPQAII